MAPVAHAAAAAAAGLQSLDVGLIERVAMSLHPRDRWAARLLARLLLVLVLTARHLATVRYFSLACRISLALVSRSMLDASVDWFRDARFSGPLRASDANFVAQATWAYDRRSEMPH